MRPWSFKRQCCKPYLGSKRTNFARQQLSYTSAETTAGLIGRKRLSKARFDGQKVPDWNHALIGFVPHESVSQRAAPLTGLHPGYHFLFGNHMAMNVDLLADGTSYWDCPDPAYKFRVWAGGDVHYPQLLKQVDSQSIRPIALVEQVLDVKSKGHGEKIFVKLRRTLIEVRVESEPGRRELRDQIAQLRPQDLNTNIGARYGVPVSIEDRWLFFTKESPAVLMKQADAKIPLCPQNGDFSWNLIPSAALLFRFSALTLNAHAIHIDPEYTKNVYGLPALVVHGPLAVYLMLHILSHGLRKHEPSIGLVAHQLRLASISYTNMAPLYVNQEMKISYRKVEGGKQLNQQQVWDVWISKQLEGVWKVAVKAVAKIIVQSEEQGQWYQPESERAGKKARRIHEVGPEAWWSKGMHNEAPNTDDNDDDDGGDGDGEGELEEDEAQIKIRRVVDRNGPPFD